MSMISTGAGLISKASAIRTGLVVAVAALSLGFGAGWQVHGWRTAKVELRETQRDLRAVARENDRRRLIGIEHARAQRDIEVMYDQLPDWWRTFVAERPGLADVDIGPDSLCLWNAWNAGTAARHRACVTGARTGAAAGGEERSLRGSDGESPTGDEGMPSRDHSAQRTD